jgi:hypothetical protein
MAYTILIEVLPQRHEERLTTYDANLHEFGKILSPEFSLAFW